MRRYITVLSLFLILSIQCTAISETVSTEQSETVRSGYTLVRHLAFQRHKLPDGAEEWLNALNSLLGDMQLDIRFADNPVGSFLSTIVYLHDATAFDWTAQIQDGVYYEQSSLMDGETVAIDGTHILPFIARIFAIGGTSSDVLPGFLTTLFDWLISGKNDLMSFGTACLQKAHAWEESLSWEEADMPELLLPGVDADTAESVAWGKQDILMYLQRQWETARAIGDLDEPTEMMDPTPIAIAADAIEDLPQLLEMYLPEEAVLRFFHIGNDETNTLCKRLEYADSERSIIFDWLTEREVSAFSVVFRGGVNNGALTFVRQNNAGNNDGISPSADCIAVTGEWADKGGKVYHCEITWDVSQSKVRDSVQNEWELRISLEKGNTLLFRVVGNGTDKRNGFGASQKVNGVSEWKLTGWGLSDCPVLTVNRKDSFEKTVFPINALQDKIFYPNQADQTELDAWIKRRSDATVSILLSMIAFIPPETAGYLLTRIH